MSENVLKITYECPHCGGEIIVERPVPQRRGVLAGKTLEEMTDEELKIEIRNAKSVLYKATKRGAAEETIARNQARVDAALQEKEKREQAAKEAEADTEVEAQTEADTEEVYETQDE